MIERRMKNCELRTENEEPRWRRLRSQFFILHSQFLILFFLTTAATAQDAPQRLVNLPIGDWLLTLPSPYMPAPGIMEVKFTHRFNQSLDQGGFTDQVHSLFGLDSNADVVFGVSYALRENLQLSLHRSNTNDTIETAAKYLVLRQSATVPLSFAVRGGVDWRTEKDLEDRTSFFAQVIVSRQFGTKAEVFLLPTVATKAGRAVTADSSGALFDHAFNVPVGFAWVLRPGLSAVLELTPPNGDLADEMEGDLGWAVGVKRQLGGHWFEILVTNSQAAFADQYVTGTFQGSALDSGDLHLGFNIERRFGRRRR
jgi:Membrane bound beta barrel domain (DUF5777)